MSLLLTFLLTLSTATPVSEHLTIPIVGGTIEFPTEGGLVPVCSGNPDVKRDIQGLIGSDNRLLDCFFTKEGILALREDPSANDVPFFEVAVNAKAEGQLVDGHEWDGIRAQIRVDTPPVGPVEGNPSAFPVLPTASVAESGRGDPFQAHVYRETPWSISTEVPADLQSHGMHHAEAIAFVVVGNRLIQVLAVDRLRKPPDVADHAAVRAQLDTLVDRIIVLNPSSQDLPGTSKRPCSYENPDRSARIAACTSLIDGEATVDTARTRAYLVRAGAWLDHGDYDKSIDDANALLSRQPANADALFERGVARRKKGELDLALADFQQVVEERERLLGAFGEMGILYEDKGDLAAAENSYSEAIDAEKDDAIGWSSRCVVRAKRGLDLDGALSDCDQALSLIMSEPDIESSVYNHRCLVHYRKKEYREAVADCDTAIAKGLRESAVYYIRSLAKRELGDTSAADDLKRAKEIWPGVVGRYAQFGIR
ncbi:MAG TPA: tetratricopeptide repeat protein [Xanthomonadaceae bacterium]|jgi:Tfp pilus assembly protein PilF